MALLSDVLEYGGIGLQLVALVLLARGPLTRYFPLFLYLASLIASAVGEEWVLSTLGTSSPTYFNVYWGSEILLDLLLMLLIVQLTSRALEGHVLQPKVVRLLAGVMVIALLVPFVAFDSSIFGRRWNQSVGQLFNFGSAVMNLVLWSTLIVTRSRDRQLLKVSAGLGITVTAAALTLGVRQFTKQEDLLRLTVDWVHRITQIAGPAIWCWAFRPVRKTPRADAPNGAITPSVG